MDFIDELLRLIDSGSVGPYYTWLNKQQGRAHIKEGLDRAVSRIEWRLKFFEAVFITHSRFRSFPYIT